MYVGRFIFVWVAIFSALSVSAGRANSSPSDFPGFGHIIPDSNPNPPASDASLFSPPLGVSSQTFAGLRPTDTSVLNANFGVRPSAPFESRGGNAYKPVTEEPLGWSEDETGPLRGQSVLDLEFLNSTRWQVCKEQLTAMFRSYLEKDVRGFLAGWARDSFTDLSILRNAVLADFLAETQVNLDLEMLEYRMSRDTIRARFRWNRAAVLQVSGRLEVTRGTTEVFFDRHQKFKVKQMIGSVPFGLRDGTLQKQVAAGNPNPSEDQVTPDPAGSGNSLQTVTLSLDPSPGGFGNVAFFDVETRQVRKAQSAHPSSVPGAPGEDFRIWIPLGFPPAAGDTRIDALGSAQVSACPPNVPLSAFQRIRPEYLGSNSSTAVSEIFGTRTDEGQFVLVELSDLSLLSFLVGNGPNFQANGAQICP